MRSAMMDFRLTVGHIFEHGRTLYADSEVVTSEAEGVRRIEFGAWRIARISWRPACAA